MLAARSWKRHRPARNRQLPLPIGTGKFHARMNYTDLFSVPGVFERLSAPAARLAAVMQQIQQVPGVLRVIDSRTLNPAIRGHPRPVAARRRAQRVPGARRGPVRAPEDELDLGRRRWNRDTGQRHHARHRLSVRHRACRCCCSASVRPGQYEQSATPADIAPTLAKNVRHRAAIGDRPGAYGSRRAMSLRFGTRSPETAIRSEFGLRTARVRSSGRKKGPLT